jgi:hypothetical protein
MDDGRFADSRRAGDVNMADEAHAVLQLDAGTEYTIRSDLDAGTNARAVASIAICSSIRRPSCCANFQARNR